MGTQHKAGEVSWRHMIYSDFSNIVGLLKGRSSVNGQQQELQFRE